MDKHVRRASLYLIGLLALGLAACAAPVAGDEQEDFGDTSTSAAAGDDAVVAIDADDADAMGVQAASQALTFTGRVPYTCDAPDNGKCYGIFGRVCHYRGTSWCQQWVCRLNGCSWELGTP